MSNDVAQDYQLLQNLEVHRMELQKTASGDEVILSVPPSKSPSAGNTSVPSSPPTRSKAAVSTLPSDRNPDPLQPGFLAFDEDLDELLPVTSEAPIPQPLSCNPNSPH